MKIEEHSKHLAFRQWTMSVGDLDPCEIRACTYVMLEIHGGMYK